MNSVLSGAYHSSFKGRGMEFAEVRLYQPGDDVRTIDWNVTARMRRPYVKRYVEERELTVMLAVDLSGSERFGTVLRPGVGSGRSGNHTEGDAWALVVPGASAIDGSSGAATRVSIEATYPSNGLTWARTRAPWLTWE